MPPPLSRRIIIIPLAMNLPPQNSPSPYLLADHDATVCINSLMGR